MSVITSTKTALVLAANFILVDEEDHGAFQEWEAKGAVSIFGQPCEIATVSDRAIHFHPVNPISDETIISVAFEIAADLELQVTTQA